MRVSNVRRTLLSAVIAGLAALSLTMQPAAAATFPASHPRILVEYDRASGQQPENVVVTPDGKLNVVLAQSAQVEEVTRGGHRRLLASLPQPADGGVNTPALGFSLATGLVRTDDGTLYVGYAAGDDSLTGIWRIRPGGQPQRIIPLSKASFPNGMALDERTGRLYIADSTRGIIWRAPITGGTATAWASGADYEPSGLLGVNGLKLRNGAVWVSNLDQGRLLRVPVKPDGSAGAAQTKASGLTSLDDFEFIGRTNDVLGTLNAANEVALIHPENGSHSTILTGEDGLQGPTSLALRGNKLYVLSAAFVIEDGKPNILTANFHRPHHH
ncbi:SMP-30/gluconolactonase/LRE family protein [Streptomyces sp. NPDC058694]|uniref:SMP-30/gluconolactonase/LRE family protein n=1 Tax=Streptomyces sp. NPDC058694 TaxID=3346603 RepID=UPI00364AB251